MTWNNVKNWLKKYLTNKKNKNVVKYIPKKYNPGERYSPFNVEEDINLPVREKKDKK